MKTSTIFISILFFGVLFALLGCQPATPAVDTAATVSAAVQATQVAQANMQATVEAATKQTVTAMAQQAPTATPTKAANSIPTTAPTVAVTAAPAKSPTPAPTVNYVALSEEELEALINQAVKEATTATTTATTTTTTYTADGTLTAQEAAALTVAVTTAQQEIIQAQQAMSAYYDEYGQLATETLATLQALEQDLNSMATSMNSMATSLTQINTTLAQGLTLAQTTVTQLQSTATKASQAAQSAQTKATTWATAAQSELNKRGQSALDTKPTNIPTDLKSTAQSVTTYIDTVKSVLGDNKISQKEMQAVSIAGANATAGLKQFSGAEGQKLTDSINTMTKQVARGEMPKAKSGIGGLEQSAKSLPSLPSGGGLPQPPAPRK